MAVLVQGDEPFQGETSVAPGVRRTRERPTLLGKPYINPIPELFCCIGNPFHALPLRPGQPFSPGIFAPGL